MSNLYRFTVIKKFELNKTVYIIHNTENDARTYLEGCLKDGWNISKSYHLGKAVSGMMFKK